MQRSLFNKIVLWAVILFLFILAPAGLNMPSQSAVRAICTGLAIDKNADSDDLTVTAQILIPQAGGQYTQKLSLVSFDSKSVEESIKMMEFQVGKKIRMAHCCFIILGKELSESENIAATLDYLVRGNNIGNNTLLIHTDTKAKDILAVTSNVNSSEVDNLQVITRYNEKYLFANGANLLSFYDDYLSPHKTSYMANITMIQNDTSSGSGGTDQSQGSGSGSGSESTSSSDGGSSSSGGSKGNMQEDVITSDGSVAIFYKGKCAKILSNKEREDFNWLDANVAKTLVQVDNISDKTLTNATIGFTVERKMMRSTYEIVNNVPTIHINYELGLRTEMIMQENGEILPISDNYVSDAVKLAFAEKIDTAIKNVMNIQKYYGFDVFNFHKQFSVNNLKGWKEYLQTLDDPEEYMKGIEIFTDVECYSAF